MTLTRSKVRATIRAFDYFRGLGPSLTKIVAWQVANTSEESIYAECYSNSDINPGCFFQKMLSQQHWFEI